MQFSNDSSNGGGGGAAKQEKSNILTSSLTQKPRPPWHQNQHYNY
jgi:hypothetical protein